MSSQWRGNKIKFFNTASLDFMCSYNFVLKNSDVYVLFLAPGSKVEKSLNPVYIAGFGVGIALLVAVVALLLLKMKRMKRSNQGTESEESHAKSGAVGVDNKGLQWSSLS